MRQTWLGEPDAQRERACAKVAFARTPALRRTVEPRLRPRFEFGEGGLVLCQISNRPIYVGQEGEERGEEGESSNSATRDGRGLSRHQWRGRGSSVSSACRSSRQVARSQPSQRRPQFGRLPTKIYY